MQIYIVWRSVLHPPIINVPQSTSELVMKGLVWQRGHPRWMKTEEAFVSYLGDRYSAEDWKDALAALFSGDGDDIIALANLHALKAIYICQASTVSLNMTKAAKASPVTTSMPKRNRRSCRPFNRFIDDQARDSDEDDDEEDIHGSPVQASNVTSILGLSAKNRLAAAINDIVGKYQERLRHSSRGCLTKLPGPPAQLKKGCISFQFIVHLFLILYHVTHCITGTATRYIAEHLQSKGFSVTVSLWVPGQLHVVSDSPKMISASLPPSHNLSVREYLCISEEEHEAVEHSNIKLPNPSWVRIKHGKYKDAIVYVFDSEQSNLFVKVLVPPRDFPYPMPEGSVTLLDSSRLPKDNTVTDIIHGEEVSGWDTPFMKRSIMAFSMQFLHAGDAIRVVKGEVHSEIGTVLSIDHALGSACLELTFDGDQVETEVQLQDLERVFCVGDTVWVVAGAYLGLEGHVIQISGDIFHLCQDISKEEQHYEPPPDESIQVRDRIEVLIGEHMGKCGIVSWFPVGADEAEYSLGPPIIQVAAAFVRWTHISQTIAYTKERGYDVRPGDVVSVARRPEYQAKGVVQSVDFPKARLTLLSESDQSLICHKRGSFLDWRRLKGLPSYVIQYWDGELCRHSAWAGTYHGQMPGCCHKVWNEIKRRSYLTSPQRRCTTPPPDRVPSASSTSIRTDSNSLWTSWDVNPEDTNTTDTNTVEGPSLSVDPSSLTLDPWTVDAQDIQDSIDARAEKVQDNGPLPWLMSKEFASQLLTYHALLKVSLRFNGGGGKLHRRFVSTACPDPFCGANGPAPKGFVAVFCASSNKGATLQHYHIPAGDLCPVPPRRKNQLCLILDGDFRGQIRTVSKCNVKLSTAELVIEGSDAPSISLRFDQICLVECFVVS
ncbi:uncharacterized protein F5147DRAFT_657116 [Suillus discolor]|uniref:KOW domain-containing protein n=1 Tax=Suillus discolor TaxID=1912936 RepID=A0A9P7EW83_9AGAM|nr:uncharacterized protein F5147DRAFT_657116 [Suillus discolor]KAG2094639.1 hypothetical protein F5147DRAFT_657116 [Suillus discolor]